MQTSSRSQLCFLSETVLCSILPGYCRCNDLQHIASLQTASV